MSELTKEGLDKLKEEFLYLTTEKRIEVAKDIKHAASFGDLKENASYHEAKDAQAFMEGRIAQLRDIISKARVTVNRHDGLIELGSTVTLSTGDTYQLVGPAEADVLKGKISYKSPMGELLMRKMAGNKIKLGATEYTIKEVK